MDIVYILGSGSVWENNELRYSLRSVAKNISDVGKIFIVGEFPEWLQNVTHIPCPDTYKTKWRNAYTKVLLACENPNLSDDFLLMNDDFFVLKPIEAESYPYYFSSVIHKTKGYRHARFLTSPILTANFLKLRSGNFFSFAVHRPIRLNKNLYLNMPRPDLSMAGFSPRSLYGNYYNVHGVKCFDKTLTPLSNQNRIESIIGDRTDIGIFSETARSSIFRKWINSKFPEPSPYEKE